MKSWIDEFREVNKEIFDARRDLVIDRALLQAKGNYITEEENVALDEINRKLKALDERIETEKIKYNKGNPI